MLLVNIDDALNNSIIPENIILFRWVKFNSLEIDKIQINKYFAEKGYVSTNLIPSVPNEIDYNLLFIIKAPKGKRGAIISNISKRTHVNEYEFLLPRNQIFKIIQVVYLKGNKGILLCNLC
ncbi:ADP-ribosyltransferase [Thermoanaerobacterium aotearoense]|nr:ADP-ribosyltransferase [Thermoanaerobacterium aotearoense]